MDNLPQIWQKALDNIKNRPEITEVSFETWLKTIKPISLKNGTLVFGVYDTFTKGILKKHYRSFIQNIIKEITGEEYHIEFVIPSEEDINPKNHKNSSQDSKQSSEDSSLDQSLQLVKAQGLNPKYTFDTFVIGHSNRFAHAASVAVAETPAKAYNPLFIYGGVGLGKTHLMHAIGQHISQVDPEKQIVYISSETFTNELINSIKDDRNVEFRNKYRNIDILLIDDIQFIAGKERTQEEFFHTFNALYNSNKQIILSSDRPPKEIPTLEDRLRSRFEWGLIADIQAPDYETRIAILRKKAQVEEIEVPDDVMLFIAKKIKSNIRELEGALIRILAYSSLTNSPITIELASEALKEIFSTKPRELNIDYIKEVVANKFNIKIEDLNSKKRTRIIAYPRQIAMYLSRELTDLSLPKIGNEFGGRDHTTVMHAYDKVSTDMKNDPSLKDKIDSIVNELKTD